MKTEYENYCLPPGTVLNDKYIVGKAMGFVSFGVTYVARNTALVEMVVITEYMQVMSSIRKLECACLNVQNGYGRKTGRINRA